MPLSLTIQQKMQNVKKVTRRNLQLIIEKSLPSSSLADVRRWRQQMRRSHVLMARSFLSYVEAHPPVQRFEVA